MVGGEIVQIYKVRDPTGTIREIRGPEGATDEQVIQQAQLLFVPEKAKPSSNTAVLANAMWKGAAAIPDMVLNAPQNLVNLGRMAVGFPALWAGRPDLAPELNPPADFARRGAEAIGLIKPDIKPQGFTQNAIDLLGQGATAGALTGGGGLTKTLVGGGMGALSAGAAGATEAATGKPELAAIAGMVAPAAAAKVPAMAEASARRLMQSALKPSIRDLKTGNAQRAITTNLDEGINVTAGGVEKLQNKITALNDEIAAAIAGSNATIDKNAVLNKLQATTDRFVNQVDPHADLAAIDRVRTGFDTHPKLQGTIPVQLAQQLKQGTYKALGNKSYGELKGAETEAQKTLARGLKDEIAAAVPEIAPKNAIESALINAKNVTERRALMEGNKNIIGLGALSHNPASLLAFLLDRTAASKSMLARGLHSGPGAIDIPKDAAERALIPLTASLSESERARLENYLKSKKGKNALSELTGQQ
jgi:hypothetical protein